MTNGTPHIGSTRILPILAALAAALIVWMTPAVARASDVNADPSTYKALLSTLKPGDTLHLAAGHYPLLQIANLNGTGSAWITIAGPASGDPAIVDADSGPCCNTIELTNSSYLALENLTVDGHNVDGAFGLSAKGESNVVHHIRVENCKFINHHGGQQHDAISTKTPTWGWVIRGNVIDAPGTGIYLGNSNGGDPFVGGLIEGNLIRNPIGYCMEIKYQTTRPAVAGMPTDPTSTIIRNNVFIKNDQPSPDGDRPNLLVGGFPASGAGSSDRYEVYGNLFFHNARESLFQASGRVTIHDNIFVDGATRALTLQDHDLPLELAYVYDNTIYGRGSGIVFGSAARQGDAVYGNLVFSSNPIAGSIKNEKDNLTDTVANAGKYVNAPSAILGQMDFYPKPGQCQGAPIDSGAFAKDSDYGSDFNCGPRGFDRRGAYAGEGMNPGWQLADARKPAASCAMAGGPDGGAASNDAGGGAGTSTGDAGAAARDGGTSSGPGGGAPSQSNGAAPSASGGDGGTAGGCAMVGSSADASSLGAGLLAAAVIAAGARRRRAYKQPTSAS